MVVPYPLGYTRERGKEWSSDSRLTHRSHSTRSRIAQYTCNRQPSRTVTFGENTPTRRIASVRKRDARRDRARRAERTSRQQQQQQQRGGREKMWVYRLLNFYFSAKKRGTRGQCLMVMKMAGIRRNEWWIRYFTMAAPVRLKFVDLERTTYYLKFIVCRQGEKPRVRSRGW